MNVKTFFRTILLPAAMALTVNAADPAAEIKNAICSVYNEVQIIVVPIAATVFLYGGVKYVYAADDPGGRKEAKKICINALVGLVIVGLAPELVSVIAGGATIC